MRIAASRVWGFRAAVAEAALIDGIRCGLSGRGRLAAVGLRRGVARLPVYVAQDRRSVVLRDELDQRLGQPRLAAQVNPVGDVLSQDRGRVLRGELLVDVVAACLVLDERHGVAELADVVVVGGRSDQEWIGPDCRRSPLAKVADGERMVVRAGGLDEQAAQQWLRRVGKFEQLRACQDPETGSPRATDCRG